MSAARVCPTCGYTHTYATENTAAAQFGRHSCDKHLRRADAARRRAERAEARPRRDCTHPGRSHHHGTRVAYVKDECRCRECTAANTAEWRASSREQVYGAPRAYVDATEAREHIQALRRVGIGIDQIAPLVHTASTHLREIDQSARRSSNRPPITQIRADLAERILAVTEAARSPHSQIDATGTRRRLEALVAVGWPLAELGTRLGRKLNRLRDLFTGTTVQAYTAQRVSDLYDHLWDTPPARDTEAQEHKFDQTRVLAAEQGWLPPLAWDDIDRDPEPPPPPSSAAEELDEIAVERATAGDRIRLAELSPIEQTEVVRRLSERGKSIRDIADQLATTRRTISRRRRINAA